MDLRRRVARSWIVLSSLAAAVIGGLSGCNTLDLDPTDYFPSKETWEKLSPSNLFYNLQPSQLQRLNEGDPGMSTDAYFSVRDPLPSDGQASAAAAGTVVPPTADTPTNDPTIVSR
jgi:hypothetical protein